LAQQQLIDSSVDELRIEAQRLRSELHLSAAEIASRLKLNLGTVRRWLANANLGRSVKRSNDKPIGTRDELLDRYFLTPLGSSVARELLHAIRFSPVAGVLPEVNDED
jgi:transcriptional regulator with XRE-family HTH domain